MTHRNGCEWLGLRGYCGRMTARGSTDRCSTHLGKPQMRHCAFDPCTVRVPDVEGALCYRHRKAAEAKAERAAARAAAPKEPKKAPKSARAVAALAPSKKAGPRLEVQAKVSKKAIPPLPTTRAELRALQRRLDAMNLSSSSESDSTLSTSTE